MTQGQGNITSNSFSRLGGAVVLIIIMLGFFSLQIISWEKVRGAISVGDTEVKQFWLGIGFISLIAVTVFGIIFQLHLKLFKR